MSFGPLRSAHLLSPPQGTQPLNPATEASGPSGARQDKFTTVSLQLQALEKQKETLAN